LIPLKVAQENRATMSIVKPQLKLTVFLVGSYILVCA